MVKKLIVLVVGLLLLLPGYSWAATTPFTQGTIEGYLLGIRVSTPESDPSGEAASKPEETTPLPTVMVAEIETYEGNRYQLSMTSTASLTIDNRPVKITEFRPGMEVYGQVISQQLVLLEAYSTTNTGYITPGSRVKKGVIARIDRNQIFLKTSTGEETYYLTPATLAIKQGQTVPLDILFSGDQVKLYFDEMGSDIVSRVEIEGDSILVKNLLKGRLQAVDDLADHITVQEVEVFKNGHWSAYGPTLKIPFTYQVPFYYAGQKIPSHQLKYYRGKTIYLVTRAVMGRETIDRVLVKNNYESAFTDKITAVNWYTEALELKNHKNFALNNGSVVIMDGRLQDKYALEPGSDAYILADGWGGTRFASLIYIYNQGINNSSLGQYYLYSGRLDQMADDRLWLKDFFILNNHNWESFSGEKEFFYDNDSSLFDLEAGKIITGKELLAADYAVDEDSDRVREKGLKDWYVYLLANGDRVTAIGLHKKQDSLLNQRVTGGIIETIQDDDLAGWTVNLRDASDWSKNKDQWMPKNSNLRITLQKAIVIKDGRIIPPEQLRSGDRLYLTRDDFRARTVIVK